MFQIINNILSKMDTITEQENPIKSGLYSPRQLFITAAFGGTAIAGFIIASNLWSGEKNY